MVRELLAVLLRAVLQWALASLLLANGAAFCLIAAVASSLGLGPPCLLCARVHHLLCSASSSDAGCNQEQDAFRRLLCHAHVAAIARPEPEQRACSPSGHHVDRGTEHDSDKTQGLEAHRRVVSIGSEICEQDRGGDHEHPRPTDPSNLERTASIGSGNGEGPYISMFELAPIVALPQDNLQDYAKGLDETPELTVSRLVAALRAQRRELEAVRAELETERRTKAEAAERRRQLEEQGEFDREAVRVAMQLVHETETEKHGLQRQLDACRVMAQLHEAAVDTDPAPFNRLGSRRSRDGGGDLIEQEDGNGNNYQSLVDFLPGSVYSSSPDLANLLKLYTEGNGARRPREGDIPEASAVAAAVITEDEEEEVVAAPVAAVSGFNGGNGEATSSAAACLHESGSSHVQAASS